MALPEITLYIHYLCPYAQRALYASAYKELPLTIEEVDLENKAEWFLALNPFGKVPTVKVVDQGREFSLYESIQVAEYFDTFPGKSLYPLKEDGSRCPLRKALIDTHIKNHLEKCAVAFFPFYFHDATPEEVEKGKAALHEINDKYLAGGEHLMHSVIGEDVITMADILMLPIIERLVAMRDTFFSKLLEGEDFANVFAWYARLSETQWAQRFRADPKRLNNLIKIARSGNYKGLAIPLSKYD